MVDALAYINKHQFVLRLGIRNVVHAKDDLYFLCNIPFVKIQVDNYITRI